MNSAGVFKWWFWGGQTNMQSTFKREGLRGRKDGQVRGNLVDKTYS